MDTHPPLIQNSTIPMMQQVKESGRKVTGWEGLKKIQTNTLADRYPTDHRAIQMQGDPVTVMLQGEVYQENYMTTIQAHLGPLPVQWIFPEAPGKEAWVEIWNPSLMWKGGLLIGDLNPSADLA